MLRYIAIACNGTDPDANRAIELLQERLNSAVQPWIRAYSQPGLHVFYSAGVSMGTEVLSA